MKKYLIFLTLLPVAIWSCVGTVDDLFDESASKRIDDAVVEYDQILRSSTNGWLVEYYPESGRAYGGYNLYFKFEDGERVLVGTELYGDDLVESLYSIKTDMGVTINFDTYNEALHYFSDPGLPVGGGAGLGYEGDYEFSIVSAGKSEIIMTGKKTHNTIRMVPLPEGMSWQEYLAQINEMKFLCNSPEYVVMVEGLEIKNVVRSSNTFTITYDVEVEGDTMTEIIFAPFMFTPKGIKLYEQIEVTGQPVREFTYNDVAERLDSNDADVQILMFTPPTNEYFCNSVLVTQWAYLELSPAFQAQWDLTLANLSNHDMIYSSGWQFIGNCPVNDYDGPCLFFFMYQTSSGAYAYAIFSFTFTPVDATDDQITMVYGSRYAAAATYYWLGECFNPIVNTLNDNSPYRLTPDYSTNPYQMRIESVNNPDIYLIVYAKHFG